MLCLPLLLALVCLLGSAPARPPCPRQVLHPFLQDLYNLEEIGESSAERSARFERSTNLSHIVGTTRKIRLIVGKQWHLQIHPDGTVNGTNINIDSDFSIMQRVSMSHVEITIQGVATCQFLCMDSCGLLYGSRQYSDDCLFNEMIQPHHFNIYSSVKHSNALRTLYLGFTKKGVPRKVQTKAGAPVGRATTFASVLTKTVPTERVEQLAMRMLRGRHLNPREPVNPKLRHHGYHKLCDYMPIMEPQQPNKQRCHKQKKKKKRKCDSEEGADDCELPPRLTKQCEIGEDEDECQRRLHMTRKKRKSRMGDVDQERLRLEKRKDSHSRHKTIVKCQSGDCSVKKPSRRKHRATTINPPDEATQPLLWQDHLGEKLTAEAQLKPDHTTNTYLSSDWTTSSATPN